MLLQHADGNTELFQILLQRFPTQINLASGEERTYVLLELGSCQTDDTPAYAMKSLEAVVMSQML
jgi:hypothetical protein